MSLSSIFVFSNESFINKIDPSEAIDYVINHPNYPSYLSYLKTWKEELGEDCSDRVEKISNMFYLGVIGNGDRSVCCYYGDYVIKLPLESCHYDSNCNEYSLIEYLKEHDNHDLVELLCPILKYDNDLIVTPICGNLNIDDEEFIKVRDSIVSKFEDAGIKFTDLFGQHQFGILVDEIVILDYEDYEFI